MRSDQTLEEFRTRFSKPKFDKYLPIDRRVAAILEYEMVSFSVPIVFKEKVCRDATDDIFINLALSAQAEFIVTGDPDLLVLSGFRNISILNASDFLRIRTRT